MKLYVNFGGFYDSSHMTEIEGVVENELDYHDHISEDDIDWDATKINYSKGYVDLLNNELDLNLKFIEIDSPKFYNYRTDELVLEIGDEDLKAIELDLLDSYFIEYVNDKLTSRDGFASYYDDGVQYPFDNIYGKSLEDESVKALLVSMFIEWQIESEEINEHIYDIEFFIEYNDSGLGHSK